MKEEKVSLRRENCWKFKYRKVQATTQRHLTQFKWHVNVTSFPPVKHDNREGASSE